VVSHVFSKLGFPDNNAIPIESRASYVTSIGAKHGKFILLAVAALLLVREAFIAATVTPSQHPKQLDEHYWYPLVALPEILAVILFVTPGLVPTRDELSKSEHDYRIPNSAA